MAEKHVFVSVLGPENVHLLGNHNDGFRTSWKDDMVIIIGVEVSSQSQIKFNPLLSFWIVVVVIKVNPI